MATCWLIKNDDKHDDYYVGIRLDEYYTNKKGKRCRKVTSRPTGIIKRPQGANAAETAQKEVEARSQAEELVLKMNQALRAEISTKDIDSTLANLAHRILQGNCQISAVVYLLSWMRESALLRHDKSGAKVKHVAISTVNRYFLLFRLLLAHLGPVRALEPLSRVTPADCLCVVQTIQKNKGIGKAGVRSALLTLFAAFEDAVRRKIIVLNPVRGILIPDRHGHVRREPYEDEEVDLILDVLDLRGEIGREWKVVINLSVHTGMRMKDAFTMRWGKIDLVKKTITFKPFKTAHIDPDREVTMPLSPSLLEVFAQLEPGKPDDYICNDLARRTPTSRSRSFNGILEEAGVNRIKVEKAHGRKKLAYRKGYYSFRATFNVWMYEVGATMEQRMDAMGQTSPDSQEPYKSQRLKLLRRLIDMLPEVSANLQNAPGGKIERLIKRKQQLLVEAEIVKRTLKRDLLKLKKEKEKSSRK